MRRIRLFILEYRLKRALVKRDTLMDDGQIDDIDSYIWWLEGKIAGVRQA